MLQITNAAMTLLRNVLDTESNEDNVFRLVISDDSLALTKVASAEEGDLVYEQEGVAVLAAPPELADGLQSQMIDVEETDQGARLVVLTQ